MNRLAGFMALCIFSLGLMAFGCTGGSDAGITVDGDDESSSDGDTIDGDGEFDTENSGPTETKCEMVKNVNDVDLKAEEGGLIQICEAGNPLDAVKIKIPKDSLLNDTHVTISQNPTDLALEGWIPVGIPVKFGASSEGEVSITGDCEMIIPFNVDDLPDGANNYHINILFLPEHVDGVTSPVFIPKTETSIAIDRTEELLYFQNNYFGVYQAFTPSEILPPTTRRFSYRGLAGISMGGGAAAMTGFRYPEKFDVLGPMGGIADTTYLMGLMHDFHMGGFCDYETITAHEGYDSIDAFVTDLDAQCGYCGPQTVPTAWSTPVNKCYMTEPREMYSRDEHAQGFNHWYYDDNGGNFNRDSYVDLFRDLSWGYGNPTSYNPESSFFPAGLQGDDLQWYLDNIYDPFDDKVGCTQLADRMLTNPIRNLYDREYNPTAEYPVIVFCDGVSNSNPQETDRIGDWYPGIDPGARSQRLDIGIAVDFNENGVRDYGEPVIRQFWEPYEDCGVDALCNEQEAGYDAESNPDPAGDDYNPYTNPTGTENDGLHQDEETFLDYGLDGVACPVGAGETIAEKCPFDYGEGNGVFDNNPNVDNFFANDSRVNIQKADVDTIKRLNVWIDGGIRDIFNFGLMGDNLGATLDAKLAGEGFPTEKYQGFASLTTPSPATINDFNFLKVDFAHLGQNVMLRYGDYNATDSMITGGDGRHVGYIPQVVYRVQTFYAFANVHFANGDYSPVEDYSPANLLLKLRFDSEVMGREVKYSVALPPGYFTNNTEAAEEGLPHQCVDRYPVVYLMHGYGQKPEDLAIALGILFGYTASGTFQKIITVFPDGKCNSPGLCRSDCEKDCNSAIDKETCYNDCITERDCENVLTECGRGNFYANHQTVAEDPIEGKAGADFQQAQIEDGMLELFDFIDTNYCTKREEVVEVDGKTLDDLY